MPDPRQQACLPFEPTAAVAPWEAAVILEIGQPVATSSNVKKWTKRFDRPLCEARWCSTGRVLATEVSWSPAAWLGLKGLLGGKIYYQLAHLPHLLNRPDFLNPKDIPIEGGISERGLLGLALAKWLGSRKEQNAFGDFTSTVNPHPKEREAAVNGIEQWLTERWGNDWFAHEDWFGPIHQTGQALQETKVIGEEVDTLQRGIADGWVEIFRHWSRSLKPDALGPALWQARVTGGMRLQTAGWEQVLTPVPFGPLRNGLLLAWVVDQLEESARRVPILDAQHLVTMGVCRHAFLMLEEGLKASGGPIALPNGIDAIHLRRMTDVTAGLKGGAGWMSMRRWLLDSALADSCPSRPRPRM